MRNAKVVVSAMVVTALLLGGVSSTVRAQATSGATTPAVTSHPVSPPKPAQTAATMSTAAASIHGNKKSHAYHLANCPSYAKIDAANLITFASEDEAIKAGFHKAKNCPK
jgi:deoxyribonuclease-1